jgi:FkbM family methyltransferase
MVVLPFVIEKNTLWEYLKTAEKPIVLYGTGDGADKIIARLTDYGVSVSGIFVSDEFVRGQQYHGIKVRSYSELLTLRENVIVLLAFASQLPEMLKRFYTLARVHETYAPHVPVFSGDETVTPDWIIKYEAELQTVYDRLADAVSRETFAAILNYKLSGKLSYLQACTTMREDDLKEIFAFSDNDIYVDAGAYDGDTVKEFLELTELSYHKIYALEPDPKNFKKLTDYVRQNKIDNVICLKAGVWNECGVLELTGNGGRQSTFWKNGKITTAPAFDVADSLSGISVEQLMTEVADAGINVSVKDPVTTQNRINNLPQQASVRKKEKRQRADVVSVDSVLGNEHADYMKFDVEGVEKEALVGAAKHLKPGVDGKLPKLLIAAYHHDEDIFALPLLLWKLQPDYKIYMRKHPYVPAWEINIFAK